MFDIIFHKAEIQGFLNCKSFEFISENIIHGTIGEKTSLLKEIGETINIMDFSNFIEECDNSGIIVLDEIFDFLISIGK